MQKNRCEVIFSGGQVGNKCRCGSIRLLHLTTANKASQG